MPFTAKGDKIMAAMKKSYGDDKGKKVFYASRNAGKIKDVEKESSRDKKRKHIGELD